MGPPVLWNGADRGPRRKLPNARQRSSASGDIAFGMSDSGEIFWRRRSMQQRATISVLAILVVGAAFAGTHAGNLLTHL